MRARYKTAIAAVMMAAATLALGGMLQGRLLYFPAHAPLELLVDRHLEAWPDATEFRGLVATARAEEPADPRSPGLRGTALLFHGNAGHAGHREYYAQALTRLGLRVVLAEYPGYGPRAGAPGQDAFVADAEETILLAHRLYGDPLLVIGESLGAAVAAIAAARHPDKVAGLMLITPWDRLEHVASFHYPWLPIRWLLKDRYDTAASLVGSRLPTAVVVAQQDQVVPARFGHALYDRLEQPKSLLAIEAAGHNDWPSRVDADWWARVIAWLSKARPEPAT
jgi:pimeloyl-ACP methyl ester carboxylesterase